MLEIKDYNTILQLINGVDIKAGDALAVAQLQQKIQMTIQKMGEAEPKEEKTAEKPKKEEK